ncbi:MAG: hypothetical protein LBP91_03070 [Coriobacteriales bacterium]|jgi:glutamate--cysteine ligase|nr:hypothetical protein [Coriobacteriales bacterium]
MDVYFDQFKPTSSVANYLSVGSKAHDVQTLGFELEHFVVEKNTLALVPYRNEEDPSAPSVQKVLEQLQGKYTELSYESDTQGNTSLFGLSRQCIAITLEPGAQLEVSIGPTTSIAQIEKVYQKFRSEIDPILATMNLQLLELGYHPTRQARNIPLIGKQRYEFMDEYFSGTGKHGICMMRATASTQVSVDYTSEEDALAKFRVANALGPFFAFITDNSPFFEAEKVGTCGGNNQHASSGLAVPHRMARMACWDDTDPWRSQVARDGYSEDFSFLRYAENLMEAPGVFLPPQNTDDAPEYLGFTSFARALPNQFISEEMVLHILGLFFFDARFKTYLELRQADSMPLEYALAFAALISGVFYNPEAIKYYADCFTYTDSMSVAFAKSALRKEGYEAEVYGRPATEWLDEMIALALDGLSSTDAPYLAPLARLIEQRKTLLDLSL